MECYSPINPRLPKGTKCNRTRCGHTEETFWSSLCLAPSTKTIKLRLISLQWGQTGPNIRSVPLSSFISSEQTNLQFVFLQVVNVSARILVCLSFPQNVQQSSVLCYVCTSQQEVGPGWAGHLVTSYGGRGQEGSVQLDIME